MRVELLRPEARLLIVGGLSAGAALALCLIAFREPVERTRVYFLEDHNDGL